MLCTGVASTVAPAARASSAVPSVDPLSTTSSSSSPSSSWARIDRTHASMWSASFSAGTTTETLGVMRRRIEAGSQLVALLLARRLGRPTPYFSHG